MWVYMFYLLQRRFFLPFRPRQTIEFINLNEPLTWRAVLWKGRQGLVGGLSKYGWGSRIRVIRVTDGVVKVMRINLSAMRRGNLSTNLMIEPGDFIYVPPTPWAWFGHAMNALLYPFNPVLGFARSIGANLEIP